ncbi:MAG: 2-amino-4-hydroxy-6-hydroxymethyldihydropteridine diphosphokinase [Gemmatimonadales bacterium]|nr:MAG: 2-amino-4-hydroxy-6-hydroxymethyldihydropteridine diphosphokinase [Gemmatimonadales bacterium]
MTGPVLVVVAAGSNLGDRMAHLASGVAELSKVVELEVVSDVVETPPEGGADQNDYLNLVLVGRTALAPRALLDELLRIERMMGRERRVGGGEPRTLDLDLIFHGDQIRREPGLILPHPRWHERPFVARPLLEIWPEGVDPESGRPLRTVVSDEVGRAPLGRVGPLVGPRVPVVSP